MMSSHLERLKPLVRRLWRSKAYASALWMLDRIASDVVRPRATAAGFTVVMSPAGDGNIGDSAMLYSFLERTRGPVKVMMKLPKRPGDSALVRDLREKFGNRVAFVSARGFYRSMPPWRFVESIRFAREINGADKFFIHGADTIDGGHASASMAAWSLCHVAQRAGIDVSVLGFSWRAEAPEVVAAAMARVSESSDLYPRDSLSADRLVKRGAVRVVQAADMAFSLSSEDEPPSYVYEWLNERISRNEQFAVFNISGLIEKKFPQTDEVRLIVDQMRRLGLRILFLPHVIRGTDSDLTICRSMAAQYGRPGDLLVETLMSPLQVKRITRSAELVVTGRMHLSILSLGNGTPVIALATAGKVEGLFGMFDLTRLVVDSEIGYGAKVAQKLVDIARDRSRISEQINKALPGVRELSMRNFEAISAPTVAHRPEAKGH